MSYNIIGDIAGRYKTLLALLIKMPKGKVLSVGDMVDRGPRSKEVLDFFMNNPNAEALLGNHEHLMLDFIKKIGFYYDECWIDNGGHHTIKCFNPAFRSKPNPHMIDDKYAEWISKLPLFKYLPENDAGLKGFVSHAMKNPSLTLEQVCDIDKALTDRRLGRDPISETILWYRYDPKRIKDHYQICGHNSHWGLKRFNDKEGEYAICIDTSRQCVLTGLHWPTMEIFQQEYID